MNGIKPLHLHLVTIYRQALSHAFRNKMADKAVHLNEDTHFTEFPIQVKKLLLLDWLK